LSSFFEARLFECHVSREFWLDAAQTLA